MHLSPLVFLILACLLAFFGDLAFPSLLLSGLFARVVLQLHGGVLFGFRGRLLDSLRESILGASLQLSIPGGKHVGIDIRWVQWIRAFIGNERRL